MNLIVYNQISKLSIAVLLWMCWRQQCIYT